MTDDQSSYEAPEVEEIDTEDMPVNAVPGQSVPQGIS